MSIPPKNSQCSELLDTSNETEQGTKVRYKERISCRSTPVPQNTFWKRLKGKFKGKYFKNTELVELINLSPQGPIYYYCKNEIIGEGGFGKVLKGFAIQGHKITPDKHLGEIPREVFILKQLPNHPTAIKFFHYQKLSYTTYAIVMERPEHSKNLHELRGERCFPFSEKKAREIVQDLASLLKEMEDINIAHRDLKLSNVIYDLDGHRVKLVDYGLACHFDHGKPFEMFCGTESYMPPEVLLIGKYYPRKETVWHLGLLTYYLLTGCKPYDDVKQAIIEQSLGTPLTHIHSFSLDAQDFIMKMLRIAANCRPNLEEILRHPWLTGRRGFFNFKCISIKRKTNGSFCGK